MSHSPDRSVGSCPWVDATEATDMHGGRLWRSGHPVDDRDDDDLKPEEDDEKSQVDRQGCPREQAADRETTGSTNLPNPYRMRAQGDLGSSGNQVRTAYRTITSR